MSGRPTESRYLHSTFCLSMGYNFDCMIASDMLFDSIGVGFRGQAIQ